MNETLSILFQCRPDVFSRPGGDTVLMVNLKRALSRAGVHVDFSHIPQSVAAYDAVHIFNPLSAFAENAVEQDTPFVVTPLYEDINRYVVRSRIAVSAFREYLDHGESRLFHDLMRRMADDDDKGCILPACAVLFGAAEAVLATGEYERDTIRRDFPSAPRVAVQPLGFSRPDLEEGPGADAFVSRYGVSDFVLCVGRLETRKNQLMLLYALKDSDVPIVFVNSGTGQPEYEQLCRDFPRRGKTILTGPIAREMLFSAYRAARVHALPSWFELPGLVSLEASWMGCSVVTASWGTTREYLGEDAFYCEPNDPCSVRRAVEDALAAPPARPDARARLARLTWEMQSRQLLALYREAGKKSRNGGVRKGFRRWRKKIAEDRALALLKKQASDVMPEDPKKACELTGLAIPLRPRDPDLFFVRAKARLSLLDYRGAASDLRRAIEIKPDYSPAAYLYLALSSLKSGRYEDVLLALTDLSAVFPFTEDDLQGIAAEYRDAALDAIGRGIERSETEAKSVSGVSSGTQEIAVTQQEVSRP